MSESGYTLAETLAALLIIGLAFGGLSEAVGVIGRLQGGAEQADLATAKGRSLQDDLEQLFDHQGPFQSNGVKAFIGDRAGFRFDCGRPSPCGAHLLRKPGGAYLDFAQPDGSTEEASVPDGGQIALSYVDEVGVAAAWPPSASPVRRLRSVFLMGQSRGAEPLAVARLWREQEPDCQFDPIAQDCRPVVR